MKKILCILTAMLLLCGCSGSPESTESDTTVSQEPTPEATNNTLFQKDEDGNIVAPSGIVYKFLAKEPDLYWIGEFKFAGSVEGEPKESDHLSASYKTGMYTFKDADVDTTLLRRAPDSEWYMIYRDITLPDFYTTADHCSRLELVFAVHPALIDPAHISCNGGITDKAELEAFLSELSIQLSPQEARLSDLLTNPDGTTSQRTLYGYICGFFDEEPNIVTVMEIWSYNDKAYSVTVDGIEHVLPNDLMEMLISNKCA